MAMFIPSHKLITMDIEIFRTSPVSTMANFQPAAPLRQKNSRRAWFCSTLVPKIRFLNGSVSKSAHDEHDHHSPGDAGVLWCLCGYAGGSTSCTRCICLPPHTILLLRLILPSFLPSCLSPLFPCRICPASNRKCTTRSQPPVQDLSRTMLFLSTWELQRCVYFMRMRLGNTTWSWNSASWPPSWVASSKPLKPVSHANPVNCCSEHALPCMCTYNAC